MDKTQLRKTFCAIRGHVPSQIRSTAAQMAAQHFIQHPYFKQNNHFAAYLCFKDEFDATPIIKAIWQANKICYLPILTDAKSRKLKFVQYDYGDALQSNRYSILEPANTQREIAPENLDIVITPLVAFDLHGHRLGTGGGYYDRTFEFKKNNSKPLFVGLGYAKQQANDLPYEDWDITLEAVLTEQQFLLLKR